MKKISTLIFIILFSFKIFGAEKNITISAASSLKVTLDRVIKNYNNKNNIKITVNYGASGALMQQIKYGAPVDIALFADTTSVEELEKVNLVSKEDVTFPIQNELVIIGYKAIKSEKELTGKIALANPDTVPLGRYSKEYLTKVGVYQNLEKEIIFAKDATATVTYVERQQVDYGIVYKTDTIRIKNSKQVFTPDTKLYSPVKYTFAMIKERKNSDVVDFFNYLNSDVCLDEFAKDLYTKTKK